MTTTSRGIDRDPVLRPVMPRRSPRAAARCRARRYSRCGPSPAPCRAASSTGSGAGVPGWPTSRWMTECPAASRALAARSTSIAMNGGTRPRREGPRGIAVYGPAPAGAQPAALTTRCVEAGWRSSRSAGRIGRRTSSPPQFGQRPPSTPSAQSRQNVHSYEQIRASTESGGRSRSQHSQFGRSSSMSRDPFPLASECCARPAVRRWCRRSCRTPSPTRGRCRPDN